MLPQRDFPAAAEAITFAFLWSNKLDSGEIGEEATALNETPLLWALLISAAPHRDFPTFAAATIIAFLWSYRDVDWTTDDAADFEVPSNWAPRFTLSSKLTDAEVGATLPLVAVPWALSTSMLPQRDFPAAAEAITFAFLWSNKLDSGEIGEEATALNETPLLWALLISISPHRDFPAFAAAMIMAFLWSNSVGSAVLPNEAGIDSAIGAVFVCSFAALSTSNFPHLETPAFAAATILAFLFSNNVGSVLNTVASTLLSFNAALEAANNFSSRSWNFFSAFNSASRTACSFWFWALTMYSSMKVW